MMEFGILRDIEVVSGRDQCFQLATTILHTRGGWPCAGLVGFDEHGNDRRRLPAGVIPIMSNSGSEHVKHARVQLQTFAFGDQRERSFQATMQSDIGMAMPLRNCAARKMPGDEPIEGLGRWPRVCQKTLVHVRVDGAGRIAMGFALTANRRIPRAIC